MRARALEETPSQRAPAADARRRADKSKDVGQMAERSPPRGGPQRTRVIASALSAVGRLASVHMSLSFGRSPKRSVSPSSETRS